MENLIIQIFNTLSLPRITNELPEKLSDMVPILPITRVDNEGSFLNSNCPLKSLKLNSPMSIDSNDLQLIIWNDFDSSPLHIWLFILVNENRPIFKLFNLCIPSILNVFTSAKQLLPISIDSTRVNREKSRVVKVESLLTQLGIIMDVTED